MSIGSIENKVSRFLLKYRVTSHSTMGVSPAELMFGRQLRTTLDLLQPNIGCNVRQNQTKQKEGHEVHSKSRSFNEGDTVFIKSFDKTEGWVSGVIDRKLGTVSYQVVLEHDWVVCWHLDHIIIHESMDLIHYTYMCLILIIFPCALGLAP